MKTLIYILLILQGCLENQTNKEENAILEINKNFKATCEVTKKVTPNSKKVIIKIYNSELIKELHMVATFAATNVAYIYFKHLKDELTEYDSIIVQIYDNSGTMYNPLPHPIEHLKEFEKLIENYNLVVEKIKEKNYEWLSDKYLVTYTKKEAFELENYFAPIDEKYGKILEINFVGCSHFKSGETEEYDLVGVGGFLIRETGKHPLDITFTRDEHKIHHIQLRF